MKKERMMELSVQMTKQMIEEGAQPEDVLASMCTNAMLYARACDLSFNELIEAFKFVYKTAVEAGEWEEMRKDE